MGVNMGLNGGVSMGLNGGVSMGLNGGVSMNMAVSMGQDLVQGEALGYCGKLRLAPAGCHELG